MNKAKTGSAVVSLVVLVVMLVTLVTNCSSGSNKAKILEEAEDYVNQSVYKDLGIVAECFDSEIVYEEDGEYLVGVRYGLDSKDWDGCYCVYLKGEYVVNCTTMLPSGFDFEEKLNELRALFGI